jgi:hypothetical protein
MQKFIIEFWPYLSPIVVGAAWVFLQAVRGYVASKADADPELNEWDHVKAALINVKPWGKEK